MKVSEVMSPNVELASPDDTLQQAAKKMARIDSGVLPVAQDDRLVGMITDRDIAIRAVAEGKNPARTTVGEVMTQDVKYCFDDEDLDEVSDNMAELQIRRLPVVNRDKRLVGIISLGDIARRYQPRETGETLRGISQPSGEQRPS
ncbi:MAG: CBS domain-containing protein [Pseudomonadota bacterium]|jgi:FOG: CBS domain|nr:MAG: CBS domain-containing protein [Pseudomonadota bacterium]